MAEALRLAIVGLNYAPEEIGIARYTADMARALTARGHSVSVISGKPYYPAWHVPQEWRGGWRKSVEDGVSITRCPLYVPAQPTGLKRIIHLASYALSALGPAIHLARKNRPQVVFCIAPALLSVPVAWIAARLSGAKLWVHIQDFEVEAAFATGLVQEKSGLAKWGAKAEALLLGLADIVSSISPQMVAKLHEKGIPAARTIEIRNWADSTIQPDPSHGGAYRAEWGLEGKKVCLYSGNIANKQGIDILIEASRKLQDRDDIAFVICGDGPNRARLQELAQGLRNIQFHGLQPSARMGELLGLATIHLLPQIPGAADLVLPSKLTNMLASGRPVVATTEQGTGLYDEVDGCGLCTKPGDAAALAQAIVTLADDPETCAAMAAVGRERSVERWSMQSIIGRLEARATQLVGGGQR